MNGSSFAVADRLDLEALGDVTGPHAELVLALPMPGVARLRLTLRG